MTGIVREEVIGNCRLILGDALEVLPGLDPVTHIITDPPYEERMQRLHAAFKLRRTDGGSQRKALNFGSIANIREPFLDEVRRLCNGWLLAFCNVEGVGEWQDAILKRELKFKTTCIWNKPDATPKMNGQGPALSYECFTTTWCGKGHARWNGGGRRGVFTHNTNNPGRTGLHPTEKPIPLMGELVTLFSNPGETVLDPFMGTGTTLVACAKLGRHCIGIEMDPKYFALAVKRVREADRQSDLFIAPPPKPKQVSLL